ncbi:hypothetical protein BDK89_2068 [Ilumatobacter fluminis]|uniref:Uncharacterized protein n=1 Tax=Ilumatobacter fluminis TaxID=467091 RepID=A0A4R7HZ16_9ACTN|nr:hypothetical protein [Ilumatobacter fluminis]TDT16477.1 hypothetical protein BDK89_2068 [Ilumatobacter fluminis]
MFLRRITAAVALTATLSLAADNASAGIQPIDDPPTFVTTTSFEAVWHATGAYNPDRDEFLYVASNNALISAVIFRADGTVRVPEFPIVTTVFGSTSGLDATGLQLHAVYNETEQEYLVTYQRFGPRSAAVPTTGRVYGQTVDATSGAVGAAAALDRVNSGDARCDARSHDVTYDPATGGYVLAYSIGMLFATTDACENLSGGHKTTVVPVSAALAPGARVDLPGTMPNSNDTFASIDRHPDTGQFLVGRLGDDGGRYTLITPSFDVVREHHVDNRNVTNGSFPAYVFVDVDPVTRNWVAVTRGSQRAQIMTLAPNGSVVTPSAIRFDTTFLGIGITDDGAILGTEYTNIGEYTMSGTKVSTYGPLVSSLGTFRSYDVVPGADGRVMVAGKHLNGNSTAGAATFLDVSRTRSIESFAPARFLETRPGQPDFDGQGRPGRRLAAGEILRLNVAGRGNVPTGAAGVVANITAVAPSGPGHVTVWDCIGGAPTASSLNYTAGAVIANEVIAKLSASGQLCIQSFAETHLIVDVVGAIPSGSPVESLAPARFYESRPGQPDFDGQGRPGARVKAGATVRVKIAGRGDVPSDAKGVIANVTAINPSGPGHVTVWDCAGKAPTASSLNYAAGTVVPNEIIAKLSSKGEICLTSFADTHLAIDVVGAIPDGSDVESLVPARFFESRPGQPDFDGKGRPGARLQAGKTVRVQIGGRGDVPADAAGVVVNVTAIAPAGAGHVTIWDCAGKAPTASSLNYAAGAVVANEVIVKLSAKGEICLVSFADTHLAVDVVGAIE